jgi:hypothetical protein
LVTINVYQGLVDAIAANLMSVCLEHVTGGAAMLHSRLQPHDAGGRARQVQPATGLRRSETCQMRLNTSASHADFFPFTGFPKGSGSKLSGT